MWNVPLWIFGGVTTGALLVVSPVVAVIVAVMVIVGDLCLRAQ